MLESDRRASQLAARASDMGRPRAALNAPYSNTPRPRREDPPRAVVESDSEDDADTTHYMDSRYCDAVKPEGRHSHLNTCW